MKSSGGVDAEDVMKSDGGVDLEGVVKKSEGSDVEDVMKSCGGVKAEDEELADNSLVMALARRCSVSMSLG